MIHAYDVKDNMTATDTILHMTNWINEAKTKGIELKDALSITLRKLGELGANNIKKGRMSEDSIEQAETYMSQFTGENRDKYLSHPHEDLDVAGSDFSRNFQQAKNYQRERQIAAQPVMDAESYTKEFKKLGR